MEDAAESAAQAVSLNYDVWPENIAIVNLFVSLATQWRLVAGMESVCYQGLDYCAVHSTLEMTGADRCAWPDLFAGLRVMEAAALDVLNDKDAQ